MIDALLTGTESIFHWLLVASWQASVLAGLVLLLQVILRRHLTSRWRYALWLLVVTRLVLPFQPESALSLFQFAPAPPPIVAKTVSEPFFVAPLTSIPEADAVPAAPVAYPFSAFTVLALVWLAGALVLLVVTWHVNRRFALHVANTPQVTDPRLLKLAESAQRELGLHRQLHIIESSQVQSPAMMGLFRPTLILPKTIHAEFSDAELRFVFLHEYAHLKRGDLVVQWLVALLQILHWFNPVLWYSFRRMRADREPATDALVLSCTGERDKESYGHVLVKLLEHYHARNSLPTLVGILEDKEQFKQRFSLITKFTQGAYGWSLLGVLLIAALATAGLTRSKADEKPGMPKTDVPAASAAVTTTAPSDLINSSGVSPLPKGTDVDSNKPQVDFALTLVEIDEKDYQSEPEAMDKAVREGNVTFFESLEGLRAKTHLILHELQPGWYDVGTVETHVIPTLSKQANGPPLTTLEAKPEFLGVNADFSWSKDGKSITSAWKVTIPTGYEHSPVAALSPAKGDTDSLLVPQIHITSYTDRDWDMAPGKVHGFWVGQSLNWLKLSLYRSSHGGTIKELIAKEKPTRLAVFMTAKSTLVADNADASANVSQNISSPEAADSTEKPQAPMVYLSARAIQISDADYQAHRAEIDVAVKKGDYASLSSLALFRVIAAPGAYVKIGELFDLAFFPSSSTMGKGPTRLLRLKVTPTLNHEMIELAGRFVADSTHGTMQLADKSTAPKVISHQLELSESLKSGQSRAFVMPGAQDDFSTNHAFDADISPSEQTQRLILFVKVSKVPETDPSAPGTVDASNRTKKSAAAMVQLDAKVIQLTEADYQANRAAVDAAVQKGDPAVLSQLKTFDQLSEMKTITKLGEQGTMEAVRNFAYPIKYEKDPNAGLVATEFKRKNVGVQIVQTSTVSDGKITVAGTFAATALQDWIPQKDGTYQPIFDEAVLPVSATLFSGQTVGFQGLGIRADSSNVEATFLANDAANKPKRSTEQRRLFLFLTAKAFTSGGAELTAGSSSPTVPAPVDTPSPVATATESSALNQALVDALWVAGTDKVGKGDVDKVAQLLSQGADPNANDGRGNTALYLALMRGKDEAAQLLVQHGADGSPEDKYGMNAAWAAAMTYYCPGALDLMIKKGVKVTGVDKSGHNYLFAIVSAGVAAPGKLNYEQDRVWTETEYKAYLKRERRIVDLLVAAGVDMNQTPGEDKQTVLMEAIKSGHTEAARALIEHGADVSIKNSKGKTAVDLAKDWRPELVPVLEGALKKIQGNKSSVEVRFGPSAPPPQIPTAAEMKIVEDAQTPLMKAFAQQDYAEARALLARGADVDAEDKMENTALTFFIQYAGDNGPYPLDILQTLLERAKNPNPLCHLEFSNPPMADSTLKISLMAATFNTDPVRRPEFLTAVQMLLSHGATFTNSNGNVESLLQASTRGDLPAIQKLVNAGTSISSVDADGWSPLLITIALNYDDAANWLIDHGADVNAVTRRGAEDPLTYAADRGPDELVEKLIAHGAKPVTAWRGLEKAIYRNDQRLFDDLIKAGVNMPQAGGMWGSSNGKTWRQITSEPLYTCIKNGQTAMALTLLDKGVEAEPANVHGNRNYAYWAVNFERPEILQALLDHGANPLLMNAQGETPLSLAQKSHPKLVPMLQAAISRHQPKSETGTQGSPLSTKALIAAAQQGDVAKVSQLLSQGADPNANLSPDHKNALFVAADNNRVDVLKLLLQNGADPNSGNSSGNAPIDWTMNRGFLEAAIVLHDTGAKISAEGWAAGTGDLATLKTLAKSGVLKKGSTDGAMKYATSMGQLEAVKFLESIEGKPVAGKFLAQAARSANIPMLEYILSRGANIKTDGGAAMDQAIIFFDQPESVKWLLTHGADPNRFSRWNQYVLAQCKNAMMVKILLDAGANPNGQGNGDNDMGAPIVYAPDAESVRLLVQHGANVRPKFKDGNTLIDIVIARNSDDRSAVMDELIKQGAEFDPKGNGATAMARAAAWNHVDTMQMLLDHQVSANAYSDEPFMHCSALNKAAMEPAPEAIKFLLSHGANPEGDPRDANTPLGFAVLCGETKNVEILRKAGAHDVGDLSIAASQGDMGKVTDLLNTGANINETDHAGNTPLYFSVRRGHPEVAKLLLERGATVNSFNAWGETPQGCFGMMMAIEGPNRSELDWGVPVEEGKRRSAAFKELFAKYPESSTYRDSRGRTALHQSAFAGNTALDPLRENEHPASLNLIDNDGNTPLILAALSPLAGELTTKISYTDPKHPDKPMKEWNGAAYIADRLIKAGAKLDLKMPNGQTQGEVALAAAIKVKNSQLISVLREAGIVENHAEGSNSSMMAVGNNNK